MGGTSPRPPTHRILHSRKWAILWASLEASSNCALTPARRLTGSIHLMCQKKDFVREASFGSSLTYAGDRLAQAHVLGWTQTTVSGAHRPRLGHRDANRRKLKPPSHHHRPGGGSATSPLANVLAN